MKTPIAISFAGVRHEDTTLKDTPGKSLRYYYCYSWRETIYFIGEQIVYFKRELQFVTPASSIQQEG